MAARARSVDGGIVRSAGTNGLSVRESAFFPWGHGCRNRARSLTVRRKSAVFTCQRASKIGHFSGRAAAVGRVAGWRDVRAVKRHLKLVRRRHLRLAHPGGCCAGVAGARRGAAASRDAGGEVRFVDAVVEQPVEDGFEVRRRLFGIGRRPTLRFGEIGRAEKPGRECLALVREQIPARGIDPSHEISDSPVRRAEPLSIRRCDGPSPYQSAGATDRAPINPPVRPTELLSIRRRDGPSSYQSAGATGRAPINPPERRAELLSIRRCDRPSSYQSAGARDRAPINPPV